MSAAELARALGRSRATVCNWMNGKEPLPGAMRAQIEEILRTAALRGSQPSGRIPKKAIRPRYLLTDDRLAFRERAGSALRDALKARRMTQSDLAVRLDVHRVNVHYWVKGKVAIPAPIAKKMGDLLGLDPTEISEQAVAASVSPRAVTPPK